MSKTELWRRRVTIDTVDTAPSEAGINFSVEVLRPIATPNQPAVLRVTMTNTSSEQRSFSTGYAPVFSGFRSDNSDNSALLLPTSMSVATEEDSLRPQSDSVAFDATIENNRLEPGDSRSEQFELFDSHDNEKVPLPPDKYRFEGQYGDFTHTDSDVSKFEWGFAITVSNF